MSVKLTLRQKQLARHALGLDNPTAKGKSYRNRYLATKWSDADMEWRDMVAKGVASVGAAYKATIWYEMTILGALSVLRPGEILDHEDFPSGVAK